MIQPVVKDLPTIKNSLVDRFLVTSFLVAAFALAGSVYRALEIGFQPVMAVHLLVSLVFGSITLFRHRFSHNTKSFTVVILLFIAGAVGIMTFGLIGAGTFVLLGAAIFARLFLNIIVALSVTALATVLMLYFLYMAYSGAAVFPGLIDDYELTVSAWLNNITSVSYTHLTLPTRLSV